MKQIVCLSHTPWSSRPSRTQQLVTRLTGADILFFEPPGPKPDKKGRKMRPNVMVYQLPKKIQLAAHTPVVARYNQRRITACIERAMDHHRFRTPLLWCTTPENVHQANQLPHQGLVYDCHRYWSRLPVAWEGELAASADVCFVASEGLSDRLSPCNQNVVLMPNGVNFPLFRREILETPNELADLAGQPVIGFVGTLHADLDISPLLLAADKHPEWTILLIGSTEPSSYLSQLQRQKNIRVLGPRPPVDLPDYLSCCDVCIHLLRMREEDNDVIPSRIYEYLSAGKPVVSMLWRHQREEFPGVVYPARSSEEFVAQCELALREDPAELMRRRRDYGSAAAWDGRAEQIKRILDTNGLF